LKKEKWSHFSFSLVIFSHSCQGCLVTILTVWQLLQLFLVIFPCQGIGNVAIVIFPCQGIGNCCVYILGYFEGKWASPLFLFPFLSALLVFCLLVSPCLFVLLSFLLYYYAVVMSFYFDFILCLFSFVFLFTYYFIFYCCFILVKFLLFI
jgi:hypothetical protein